MCLHGVGTINASVSSQDEEVQQHIANAMMGVIEVGSYRPSPLSAPAAERGVDWTELGSEVTSTHLRGSHPATSTTTTRPRGMTCAPLHCGRHVIARSLHIAIYIVI